MRKLAIFAASFSCSVFCACYVLPEKWLQPGGIAFLTLFLCSVIAQRFWKRNGLRSALICAGLFLGLTWFSFYRTTFFLPALVLDNQTVHLSATVADWPRESKDGYSVLVYADTDAKTTASTVLYTDEQGADLRPGDRINSVVHCTTADRTFAGEEISYYLAKGIFLRGVAYGRLDIECPENIPIRFWPAILSRSIKAGIDNAFSESSAPLVRALVTGNRDHLTDEFTTSLQRTGLSHTVAVSGMHLAFLASLLTALMGRGKRSTALMTTVAVLLFCGVAGNTPSVLRAAVMILMLQLAPLLGRERDAPTSLAFALMLLLLWNPMSAAHVGLQLSFSAVAGIQLASDRIQDWLLVHLHLNRPVQGRVRRLLWSIPKFPVSVVSATLGASLLTVPLAAAHFKTISLIAPLSNLMTLWSVSLVFLGGLFSGIVSVFSPMLGALLAVPFEPLVKYLTWAVELLARPSMAALPLMSVYYRAWLGFLYIVIGLTFLVPGRKRAVVPVCACVFTLSLSVLLTSLDFRRGDMMVTALDVGQGQSILLRTGEAVALVDCGGNGPDNAGDVAADFLQAHGVNRVDLLVLSHYHADHANGITQLMKRVRVCKLALPDVDHDSPLRQQILELAKTQDVEVYMVQSNTEFCYGSDYTVTVYPPLGQEEEGNEAGLTVLTSAHENDVLITGDMGEEIERALLRYTKLPDVELFVAGHHGSQYSNCSQLLETIRPERVLVSAGHNNRYGHPAPETLERLDAVGAEVFRTDLSGTITVRYFYET